MTWNAKPTLSSESVISADTLRAQNRHRSSLSPTVVSLEQPSRPRLRFRPATQSPTSRLPSTPAPVVDYDGAGSSCRAAGDAAEDAAEDAADAADEERERKNATAAHRAPRATLLAYHHADPMAIGATHSSAHMQRKLSCALVSPRNSEA